MDHHRISYRALTAWARVGVAVFYRRVEVTEDAPVRPDRPTIFAANHSNALVDVAILVAKTPTFPHFLAASTWWMHAHARLLFRWGGVLPVHRSGDGYRGGDGLVTRDNTSTFEACRDALTRGEHLAIFPEGEMDVGSALLPVKTGAARIGLGAAADDEVRGVVIIPVGLVYEDRDRFRSSVEIHFGAPIEMDDWVDRYHHDSPRAVREVTDLLADRLAAVTVSSSSTDLVESVSRAATMALADTDAMNCGAPRNALCRRLVAALDDPEGGKAIDSLGAAITTHADDLDRLGFDDSQSLEVASGSSRAVGLIQLVLLSPAAALGAMVNLPAVVVVRLLSPIVRLEGWQSTTKAVGGSFLLPVTWAMGLVLGSRRLGARRATALTLAGAAGGLATLSWLDRVKELRRAALVARTRRTRPTEMVQAQRSRAEVVRLVDELVGCDGAGAELGRRRPSTR